MRGDQEQVNWADKTSRSKGKNPQPPSDNPRKGSYQNECNYCGARASHPKEKCRAVVFISTHVLIKQKVQLKRELC